MERTKKQIKVEKVKEEPIICNEELDTNLENEDNDEGSIKAEILIGNKFKISITKRNYEILEWVKTNNKNKDGIEVEFEGFRNHCVYLGTLEQACKYLINYIAKQKLCSKKIIPSLTEAIQIIRDSHKETHKLFKDIADI